MTKETFEESYKFCLKQGWVHNTPLKNVLDDYFDKKNGRQKMFNDHIEKILKNSNCKEINILIGEAPPYYPNDQYPIKKNRQYFYDSAQSMNTGYFIEPCKHFLNINDWKKERKENPKKKKKDYYLEKLVEKGVLIFDIFPFPIFQSTDIREKIVLKDGKSSFMKYLDDYFVPRLKQFIEKIKEKHNDVVVNMYLFAPKLASVQFLFWFKENEFCNYLIKFDDKVFKFSENSKSAKKEVVFLNKPLKDFVYKITQKDENALELIKELKKYPIFMNNSGNPDFNKFVNGKKLK